MESQPKELVQQDGEPNPKHTLDYYVEARDGNKRNYIFSAKKTLACDHPNLKIMVRGGTAYRCTECNYVHVIVTAYTMALHQYVKQGVLSALHFAKEFGSNSLNEVLRRPSGQVDGSPHKPVLPEGMSMMDTLKVLDEVDVNTPDGGGRQMRELRESMWVDEKERVAIEAREQRQLLQDHPLHELESSNAQGDHEEDPEDKEGGD